MKQPLEDMEGWQRARQNDARPFLYTFPRLPPFFRRCRAVGRALWLAELGLAALLFTAGIRALWPKPVPLFWGILLFAAPLLYLLVRLLRHIPRFFWRCPGCGLSLPYYAPPPRGLDTLRNEDTLEALQGQHIPYYRFRGCPLVFPTVCPSCRQKFFAPGPPEGDA